MVNVYRAPKPTYSSWEWLKFIAVRIVFPPVLLWDVTKFLANKVLGQFIGGNILTANNDSLARAIIIDETITSAHATCQHDLLYEHHQIITHDGACLDTREIQHTSQQNNASQDQTYIINFVSDDRCYEDIFDEMEKDANNLKTNVVGFNYRGVNHGTDKAQSSDDLVIDGIAQVQRLLDKGVSPQNITLKGDSLGGAVATLVAQHFHQSGHPINLFNSRYVSTVTDIVVGDGTLEHGVTEGHQKSNWRKRLDRLLKPVIQLGLILVKWEINVDRAYKRIPDGYKDSIMVRSGDKNLQDPIDGPETRYKDQTTEQHEQKAAMNERRNTFDSTTQQRLLNNALTKEALFKARDQCKDRTMQTNDPDDNGHNAQWKRLSGRSGVNTQTTSFAKFFERIKVNHGHANSHAIDSPSFSDSIPKTV